MSRNVQWSQLSEEHSTICQKLITLNILIANNKRLIHARCSFKSWTTKMSQNMGMQKTNKQNLLMFWSSWRNLQNRGKWRKKDLSKKREREKSWESRRGKKERKRMQLSSSNWTKPIQASNWMIQSLTVLNQRMTNRTFLISVLMTTVDLIV